MIPYLVDITEILDDKGASLHVTEPFALDVLHVGDESFELIEPAAVDVTVDNAGTGIVAFGSVHARTTATCSRCLIEFELPIRGEVEGFYVTADAAGESDEDAERILRDGSIDLAPAMVAALVIEAPFAPLHDPECEGLCPDCGADLNSESCECASEPGEPHPFEALRGMFPEERTDTD